MRTKRGSTLLSMIMTIGGVGAVAAAGFVFTGGECGVTGSCSDKAEAKVVAASNTETAGKSCCDLGAVAKKATEATVLPAANVETAKSECSAKSSCCDDKATAKVVEANNVVKSECSEAKSSCDSKAETAAVVQASNVEKTECAEGESCCKAGAKTVPALSVSNVAPCASTLTVAAKPAAAASSCCSAAKTTSNVATLECGSKNMPVRIVASASPVVMPAMFFQAVSMKSMDMTQAGCCRSAAENASGLSTCSGVAADGSEKSCCDEGVATIPASNVEASECSKGDSCCSSDAKVVEASNTVEAECSKGESCCKADAEVIEANNVEKSECSEAKSCCDKAEEVASN